MKKIKMILTASGCPGASTFIKEVKNNGEREIEIVGVDMDPEAIGKFLCDKFYVVPAADDPQYIPKIKELIKKEKPDVFFPASSYDVNITAEHKDELEALGTVVVISSKEALEFANDKYKMYKILKEKTDIPLPKFYYPKDLVEFEECAKKLGYPEKEVCFKPHYGKGSRGFRIINDNIDRKDLLMNQKPMSTYISMAEFKEIFKEGDFPKLLLSEVVKGTDYDLMTLCKDGEELLTTIKTRESQRAGVITRGELIRNEKLVEITQKILSVIKLSYNISIQFIGDYLIEINPRTSTYIYQDDLKEPYIAIKLALGELTNEQVKEYRKKIKYGRRMIRYMDQIFF